MVVNRVFKLLERTCLKRGPGDINSQISVGEIVIVKDEHLPHGLWKLGIVQEIVKG